MITIRPERPEDEEALFQMYRRVFGRLQEARLVDSLRENQGLFLSLVALAAGTVVGGVAFSTATLEPRAAGLHLLALAPLAVLPTYQRLGIGSGLVQIGLAQCRDRQVDAIVVVGEPEFFGKFGFVAAAPYQLTCPFPVPEPFWLVQELHPGALTGVHGRINFRPEFADITLV